uniref:Integrase, catalytic region, zinc finger, CCHC-type, peptidase aspartic, catalytic n=1 Tax=Tanacetum cinerariifolium TaxID=118510 RepID=A0A6L2JV69_TANCI|nr:hypothetical protein [Tanacetum cinerariifolium]
MKNFDVMKESTSYVSKHQQEWDAWVEKTISDKDDVIPEDETPELIIKFQNVDKRVPTIFDCARMDASMNDMLSNQFRNAEEYTYHLEQATNFMENKIVWESKQEDIRRPIPKPLIFYRLQRNPNEHPRKHGRMILESVEHGLLIWPTVEENGATRTKKYVELSAAEKIQADCDMKETNIILQGLPSDIYSLVNRHRVSKDLWERIQLLMQGNSLTKQERESILYDAFDKFAHIKRESLHLYYLRFTQLINDMNIYNMKLEQFQLHAYLEQHELHANEVRLLRERNQDPLAFMENPQMTPPHFNTYQSSYNYPQLQQQFLPSQYGLIHPTQHYSSTYPSQSQFNHSSIQSSYHISLK